MRTVARRNVLKFLAASPLLGYTTAGRLLAEESLDAIQLPDFLIKSPDKALDVFDFHAVARHKLPTAHYGYLATGTDGNETLSANRRAFKDLYLRPMRMVDTSNVSLRTTLLGEQLGSPMELYNNPANRFVAGFLGAPSMNFLPADKRPAEVIAFQQGRLHSSYTVLNDHLDGRDWMVGTGPTHADFCACGYLFYPEPFGFDRTHSSSCFMLFMPRRSAMGA